MMGVKVVESPSKSLGLLALVGKSKHCNFFFQVLLTAWATCLVVGKLVCYLKP